MKKRTAGLGILAIAAIGLGISIADDKNVAFVYWNTSTDFLQ